MKSLLILTIIGGFIFLMIWSVVKHEDEVRSEAAAAAQTR